VPVILIGTALLSLMFAALMMIAAAFARTYKEGQSLASPIYMLVLLPLLAVGLPDESIGLGLAAVPVVNTTLLFEQVLVGDFRPAFIAVTLGSSALAVAGCLWVAAKLLRNETLMLGSFQGTPSAFLRSLLRREKR
jgi:sodium transport system permease protein